jgi:high-affinity Fe2+/Pb2+ permease
MIYWIIGLGTLNVLLLILVYFLFRKQEKSYEILYQYFQYLDKISKVIELSDKRIKDLDHRETFKSDDEIGFFFNNIKDIQDILNNFIIKSK